MARRDTHARRWSARQQQCLGGLCGPAVVEPAVGGLVGGSRGAASERKHASAHAQTNQVIKHAHEPTCERACPTTRNVLVFLFTAASKVNMRGVFLHKAPCYTGRLTAQSAILHEAPCDTKGDPTSGAALLVRRHPPHHRPTRAPPGAVRWRPRRPPSLGHARALQLKARTAARPHRRAKVVEPGGSRMRSARVVVRDA